MAHIHMKKLEYEIKERLEDVLDREFPKGECKERGNALMLFAHAMSEIHNLLRTQEINSEALNTFLSV